MTDFDLLKSSDADDDDSLLTPKPKRRNPAVEQPVKFRRFDDIDGARSAIYDSVFDAAKNLDPVTNQRHTLALQDVYWGDDGKFSKADRKAAIIGGRSLGRRLRGTWVLTDNATGDELGRKEATVFTVPHLTEGGTFVHNGNELVVKNQQRLRAGSYAREKENGELENFTNVLSGGPSHRYFLDPAKGLFNIKIGQSNMPLLPVLKALGATDKEIRDAWGNELYATNYAKGDASVLPKLAQRLIKKRDESKSVEQQIRETFEGMKLDPEVTHRTMSRPFERIDKDAMLDITKKLLAIQHGTAKIDDRDHLAYQTFLGPEDIFAERVKKDRAGLRRLLLFKASNKGSVDSIPAGALQGYMDSALLQSGLAENAQEINPLEILDKLTQVTRMGEGGLPSHDAIPDESRSVSPSQMGFCDPVRTPENFRVGVDIYAAGNALKGNNGKLYAKFLDARSGKEVWHTPQAVADMTVTFPGVLQTYADQKRVPAMRNGEIHYVDKRKVDLVLPHFETAFSPLGNMIPLKSMVKPQRMAMASRMTSQALSLVNPEAPLVQNAVPGTNGQQSFEDQYGVHAGAVRAEKGGQVVSAGPGQLRVRYDDGKLATVDLHDHTPYNRKSFLHQTPVLEPGQRFKPGQLLAKSNFTDDTGAAAVGLNARVAYMPWAGKNFEDAFVISEGLAKRLTSNHAYQHQLDVGESTKLGKKPFISLFPAKYDKKALENLDDRGIVRVGTQVNFADPLILAAEQRETAANKVHRKAQPGYVDASITWEHHDPGVVTDVVNGKNGPVVVVKSTQPMQEGDKLSGRYGDKGIVSAIIPDAQMPTDKDGKPFEILSNPLGVISRTNPAQWTEAKLGEIARKLGHPIKVEDFDPNVSDRVAWTEQLMKQHGIPDTEDVLDPNTGNKIPGVYTGTRFFMKLQHQAEGKSQGRSGGSYSAEETPTEGSKRISMLDVSALLSSGATEVLRDASSVRGQRNEDYWLQFMQGFTPRDPKVPMVYNKFLNELKAAGINVVRDGSNLNIMGLTDKDIDKLAEGREIKNSDTVSYDSELQPRTGGLFDPALTGGHHGLRWSCIKLNEPMPSPVFEEPIRRVLGLTQKSFEAVLAGRENLPNGGTGPQGISEALAGINLNRDIMLARHQIKNGSQAARDAAVRKLGYLKNAQRLGLHPKDWVWTKAPVLPPQFRPINMMGDKNIPLVSDANYLYKELFAANKNLENMKEQLGPGGVGDERLAVYHALKAVTGLGDPITQQSQDKQVRGLLANVFGSSPKYSTVQRKLISSTVDNVGRAVASPDPDLDMDQIGLPEDKAFDVYSRFVVRRLRRSGMPVSQALQQVKERTPLARQILLAEMDERPVIVNRAPVLHRYGIMAFKPTLSKGTVLRLPVTICKGFNLDFDGDQQIGQVFLAVDTRLFNVDNTKQEVPMPAYFKTALIRLTGEVSQYYKFFVCNLEDFPRTDHLLGRKDGISFYAAPDGVFVFAHSPDGGLRLAPVTGWSQHEGRAVWLVTLGSGRQIITDDDPRAIYGLDGDSLEWCRRRPGEAQRQFVPVVRSADVALPQITSIMLSAPPIVRTGVCHEIIEKMPLDSDMGYLLGLLIGDGWCDYHHGKAKAVNLANDSPEVGAYFSACIRRLLYREPKVTYTRFSGDLKGKLQGSKGSSRWTVASVVLAAALAPLIGHKAEGKHLPDFTLAAPKSFCRGLLAGLFDTDGSFSCSHAKTKAQFMANISSKSLRLLQELQHLLRRFSVTSTITPTKTPLGDDFWVLSLSTPELHGLGELPLRDPRKLARWQAFINGPCPSSNHSGYSRARLIPVPEALAREFRRKFHGTSGNKFYTACVSAISKGYLSKTGAKALAREIDEHGGSSHPLYAKWRELVFDDSLAFERVTDAVCTDRVETGYDLTVPGCETFMSVDGVILSNTMQYHVPTDEGARKEALDRLLPSRQLLSPADFRTPVHVPGQEYTAGLSRATDPQSVSDKPVRTFRNKRDVKKAWLAGEIGINDRVRILES